MFYGKLNLSLLLHVICVSAMAQLHVIIIPYPRMMDLPLFITLPVSGEKRHVILTVSVLKWHMTYFYHFSLAKIFIYTATANLNRTELNNAMAGRITSQKIYHSPSSQSPNTERSTTWLTGPFIFFPFSTLMILFYCHLTFVASSDVSCLFLSPFGLFSGYFYNFFLLSFLVFSNLILICFGVFFIVSCTLSTMNFFNLYISNFYHIWKILGPYFF